MRMAIPVWQLRVSPVFDSAGRLLICDIKDGHEISRTRRSINGLSLQGRVKRLVALDVDVLLCGAVSRPLAGMITASGIKVIPCVTGEVDEVLGWYMSGKPLDARFLMPGCGGRGRRLRGQRRKGSGRHWANYPEDIP